MRVGSLDFFWDFREICEKSAKIRSLKNVFVVFSWRGETPRLLVRVPATKKIIRENS